MAREIVIHIGTHKTGSTTLQNYLANHREQLIAHGICYFRGSLLPNNHIELYLSCLDRGRDSLALQTMQIGPLDTLFDQTHANLTKALSDMSAKTIIFSTEGLSLLRSDEEMERLARLIGSNVHHVRVVCVLRNKSAYLKAYRKQIIKVPGRKPSNDSRSSFYVESDSWLADYDALLGAYRAIFGTQAVRIVDYDREMQRCGDVLPTVLREMSVPEPMIPKPGAAKRDNTTSFVNRLRQVAYGLRVRLFGK